jgi:hypothetical protein
VCALANIAAAAPAISKHLVIAFPLFARLLNIEA